MVWVYLVYVMALLGKKLEVTISRMPNLFLNNSI